MPGSGEQGGGGDTCRGAVNSYSYGERAMFYMVAANTPAFRGSAGGPCVCVCLFIYSTLVVDSVIFYSM